MQNIPTLTTKEFRDNLAEILEKVAIGKEKFLISKFGKEKALIVPVDKFQKSTTTKEVSLPGFGIWKKRKEIKNSASWITKLRAKQSFRKKISG